MGLDAVFGSAWSGLDAATRRLQVVAQNVANAGTAGYARESANTTSVVSAGVGSGTRLDATTRNADPVLQQGLYHANAQQAALAASSTALSALDAVSGTVAAGTDIASRLGALQDGFTTLAADPTNATAQRQTVQEASDLTGALNDMSNAIGAQRQAAQDNAVTTVRTLNTTLYQIGALTDQIRTGRAAGQSTADLENSRDAALGTVSGLVDVTVIPGNNGDILLASGGTILPLRPSEGAVSLSAATVNADTPTAAVPPLMLNGSPISVTGGALGGALAVRDQVLPAQQASLDEFAHTLATRFDAQGLTLFTGASGTVPPGGTPYAQSGYTGFAGAITVNPAVTATPSLVRNGTHAVAGSATGASAFTTGGSAGSTTLITRVLDYALGTQVQTGVPQPDAATAGLGIDGTIAVGGTGAGALSTLASALVAGQSQQVAGAASQLSTATAFANTLQTRLTSTTGVSVDSELSSMVQLQNAYTANARVLTTAKEMFASLLEIVQ